MIRILTWNVWYTHGDWEARQEPILDVLETEQPDVILLQESFDVIDERPAQAQTFGERLGFEYVVGPEPDGFDAPVRNALLSRWPIQQAHRLLLTSNGPYRYRSVVGAHIETPDGVLPVFTTHLEHRFDRTEERQQQLTEALTYIDSVTNDEEMFPPVFTGDLNAVPDSDDVRRLTGRSTPYKRVFIDAWDVAGEGPGLTYTSANPHVANKQWPNRRLDYVTTAYSSGPHKLRVQDARLVGVEPIDGIVPSDHYGVLVDYQAN